MLGDINKSDLPRLREIIADTVHGSIDCSGQEATALIEEISQSLADWMESGLGGFHRTYAIADDLVGFVVVQDHCQLTHLFVLPGFQGRGIGRSLVEAAVESCRHRSPCKKIYLNASTNACGFYEALGFRQVGPGVDRPGGCIPYEYQLSTLRRTHEQGIARDRSTE